MTDPTREALEAAQQFIRNGVELGYIRMPNHPDPALETLPKIEAALKALTTSAPGEQQPRREAPAFSGVASTLADRLEAECKVRDDHPQDYDAALTAMFRECVTELRRPDAGCGVRETVRRLLYEISWEREDNSARVDLDDAASNIAAALSNPSDAGNASVEARLPDWGQIVQILLRCMDATIKNETSREQAERMTNELLGKYPAISPAVGGEAKKSEGGPMKAFDETFSAETVLMESFFPSERPSDPTADVTVGEIRAFLDAQWPAPHWDIARALLDAFTVGRR